MDLVYSLLVAAHLLGMAALVGGYLSGATASRTTAPGPVMVWGARTQLVTGLALVGLGEAVLDVDYNHVKIGVKLVLAVVVAGLVEVVAARMRRGAMAPSTLVHTAGALAVVTVLVAVLWS